MSNPLPKPGSLGLIQYAGVDMLQYAAAELAAARDCHTCAHYVGGKCWVVCTDADRYEALPVVRLWRMA